MSRRIPDCVNPACPDHGVPCVPGRTRQDEPIWHCLSCDYTTPRTERPPGRSGLWHHLKRAQEEVRHV